MDLGQGMVYKTRLPKVPTGPIAKNKNTSPVMTMETISFVFFLFLMVQKSAATVSIIIPSPRYEKPSLCQGE